MPQQQELYPSKTPEGPRHAGIARKPRRRWLRTMLTAELLLALVVRVFVGVIVLVLPWSRLWDSNSLMLEYPRLAVFFSLGATRGIVSGLGLLNLWIAVDETLHRGGRHA